MPLKIVATRNAKTTNLYVRGSYLGVSVDRSCKTDRRSVAVEIRREIERQIEQGTYGREKRGRVAPTFVEAATNYLRAGKRARYVSALIKYFGETPIDEIDQAAIDAAALIMHPNVSNTSRNSYVYTPVSAILHHAGRQLVVKRPKGAKGNVRSDWLSRDDAFGILAAAERIDREFATLLAFLLYTGARIGGALQLLRSDVDLEARRAWARPQKNQPHHAVRLNEDLCRRLAELFAAQDAGDEEPPDRVFRFRQGGNLKHLLTRARMAHVGLACPARRPIGWCEPPHRLKWATFHVFRHTWATWMRQYGGVDTKGLVATGNWRDERSASRYAHADPRQEWARVDDLPVPSKQTNGTKSK
jgi:integrase